MSYDLMIFEESVAPKKKEDFMLWYSEQVKWKEDHDYQDHSVTSEALRNWFMDMIKTFPPMNGPLASFEDDDDDEKLTDYSIGKNIIYAAFAWSVQEEAYKAMRTLAIKHKVGFFDVSTDNGEILFPSATGNKETAKPWWKIW
jgi:hypothetical protein